MHHVYIHVPFCARRCVYCDFAIAVRKRVPADRYLDAVRCELDGRRNRGEWDDEPLKTLYLGGGTPSLLGADQLARLIGLFSVSESVVSESVEVTLEANPDDVTPEAARSWVAAGVNRASLGVQSFEPQVLAWMHRTHRAEASAQAMTVLRAAGVRSVSLDLILALPDAVKPNFRRDLDRALSLEPDHLSVYGLTVERGTALSRWVARGTCAAAPEDRFADEFLSAHEVLTATGFEHYEVSNYARPGHTARHNRAYWIGRPYAGLGPSAHSYRADERSWNVEHWAAYERVVRDTGDATAGRERLSPSARALERVYLGLRMAEGVSAQAARGWDNAAARGAASKGWLVREGNAIRLTPEGWLHLDDLVPLLTTFEKGG